MTPAAAFPAPLEHALVEGGLRSVNFFNGRLLSAEDLRSEQAYQDTARRRLARMLGEGVAYGLEVSEAAGSSSSRPLVTVQAGIAITRAGSTLELPGATDVSLVRESTANGTTPGAGFEPCSASLPGTYAAGAGIYLLVLAPAQASRGRAPVSGLGNVEAACNTDAAIQGVQFQLLHAETGLDLTDADLVRNRLAHLCFGTDDPRRHLAAFEPLGPPPGGYGLLDDLRRICLGPDQVPLSALLWNADCGIQFLDLWSVRRRLTAPDPAARGPAFVDQRRASESEAMFLQFQAQVRDLSAPARAPADLVAADHFDYLPPLGLLPLAHDGVPGFDAARFFGDQASLEVAVTDAALVRSLAHESIHHEPIPVGPGGGKIQLYQVYENLLAVAAGQTRQSVLLFASAALPYQGIARFQLAQWDRSRFAAIVR
jgi:hypothetical protein